MRQDPDPVRETVTFRGGFTPERPTLGPAGGRRGCTRMTVVSQSDSTASMNAASSGSCFHSPHQLKNHVSGQSCGRVLPPARSAAAVVLEDVGIIRRVATGRIPPTLSPPVFAASGEPPPVETPTAIIRAIHCPAESSSTVIAMVVSTVIERTWLNHDVSATAASGAPESQPAARNSWAMAAAMRAAKPRPSSQRWI